MAVAVQSAKKQHLLLLVVTILCAADAATQPNPNCTTTCGSLKIPFPFGTTEACALDSTFLIDCNKTSSNSPSAPPPPTPFLRQTNFSVLNISLIDGELCISWPVASDCYSSKGKQISETLQAYNLTRQFSISSSRNKLIVVGCDTVGVMVGYDPDGIKSYATGCVSWCDTVDDTTNGSCDGAGCCESSFPGHGLLGLSYGSAAMFNHTGKVGFNPCGYAFPAEDGAYDFVSTDLKNFHNTTIPVVLDWAVGNQTCEEAKNDDLSYACKAEHSECYNSTKGVGYICHCSTGFRGNPYILNGCHDIDECTESDVCYSGAICHNFPGSYNCSCPDGYIGDGRNDGTKCALQLSSKSNSRTQTILIIALSVSVGVLALLMGSFYVYWGMKKRKLIKLKEQFFQQNGGLLLQQQIAKLRGSSETAKVFTVEELKRATNNFDERKILGQGGQGTVYKGLLLDNRTVAIKKSKLSDPSQIEQFINEVLVLSQINHRNVVKLLGCCLETEVPLLVYEFIPNGTISEHLHDPTQSLKLNWKTRLRLAAETAGALAYLHSATSMPIIHRDVKTTNILLDRNLTAKVSDFGASRIVPLDKAQLTTLVQGTLGYLDPEYFHTSQLTEKSDVYSFGVVLAELLTGMKALSFNRPEEDRNLALYFISSMKEGHLLQIVDSHIMNEAKVEQLMEFANIAKRCLRLKGEERPTMKEVAKELEGLIVEEKHRWESDKSPSEETESLLRASQPVYHVEEGAGASGSGISSGFDSIIHIPMSLSGGR